MHDIKETAEKKNLRLVRFIIKGVKEREDYSLGFPVNWTEFWTRGKGKETIQ